MFFVIVTVVVIMYHVIVSLVIECRNLNYDCKEILVCWRYCVHIKGFIKACSFKPFYLNCFEAFKQSVMIFLQLHEINLLICFVVERHYISFIILIGFVLSFENRLLINMFLLIHFNFSVVNIVPFKFN